MIEPTDEMVQLIYERIDFQLHGSDGIREGLTAVFAVVERDRSDAAALTRAANAARRIADRYGEKGTDRSKADWRMWTAMSAGARAVVVRLIELADAEEAP